MRRGKWKIVLPRAGKKQIPLSLFDMTVDPGESNVISASDGHEFFVVRNIFRNVGHVSLVKENSFMTLINNTVDTNTGPIEIRVVLENKRLSLFPGLFVRIKTIGPEVPDAVLVPESAVGSDLGGKYLYIVGENNIVEQRYVTLGLLQEDGTVQIPEGVSADDTVIVNGLMFARPGLPVTPMTAEQFGQMQQQMAEQGTR